MFRGAEYLLDIHCHLLPGMDDGPDSIEESIEMARIAVNDGIKVTVATPHFITGINANNHHGIISAVKSMNAALKEENIPLSVLPGMELRLEPTICELYRQGALLGVGGQNGYLLVDFHPASLPLNLEKVVFQIALAGARVIIAHPERNREIVNNPELLYPMLTSGALLQINGGSLTGNFGSEAKKTAELFLSLGWASFIATDAHSTKRRPPTLSGALRAATKLIGQAEADKLVFENPHRIIQGLRLQVQDITPYHSQRGWFVRYCPWIKENREKQIK